MLILTSRTLPPAARTTRSMIGPSCLQGPHQGAQKSTMTGWLRDASITSFMKFWVSLSLTTSPLAAGLASAFLISPDNRAIPIPSAWQDRRWP